MKAILRKAKNKYKCLDRGISLDSLCGNRFWKNEITVTKYLCGMTILQSIKKLRDARAEAQGISASRRFQEAQKVAMQKDPSYFRKLVWATSKKTAKILESFEKMKKPISTN